MVALNFFGVSHGGIVRFSSKIKRKNQERLSVIYTELATTPKFHRTAGANQARRKRRSLQAGRGPSTKNFWIS